MGKTNFQLIASKENQDRAKCGKNEAGGMISFVCRTRKYLGVNGLLIYPPRGQKAVPADRINSDR